MAFQIKRITEKEANAKSLNRIPFCIKGIRLQHTVFIFHRSSPLNNVDGSSLLIQRQAAWWEALAFIETTMYSNNIELKLVELLALLCNINSRHWGVFLHNGWVGPLHNSHCWQANSLPLCSPLSSIETSTMQEYVVWSYSLQVTCLPWLSRTALARLCAGYLQEKIWPRLLAHL